MIRFTFVSAIAGIGKVRTMLEANRELNQETITSVEFLFAE